MAFERPSSFFRRVATGLLMSNTGHIAFKMHSCLLSCPLKAIGDGDGQHCHRCNDKKQPKAYDQPKAV
jgi:hypothetical protein